MIQVYMKISDGKYLNVELNDKNPNLGMKSCRWLFRPNNYPAVFQ